MKIGKSQKILTVYFLRVSSWPTLFESSRTTLTDYSKKLFRFANGFFRQRGVLWFKLSIFAVSFCPVVGIEWNSKGIKGPDEMHFLLNRTSEWVFSESRFIGYVIIYFTSFWDKYLLLKISIWNCMLWSVLPTDKLNCIV